MSEVILEKGGWRAALRPELGGVLASLTCSGTEILRSMSADATNPLDSAAFPLVPYANRISDGRFEWAAVRVHLPHNFPPETSSIHGMGWQSAWRIAEQRADFCVLELEHPGLGALPWQNPVEQWPWAYRARQTVRLEPGGATIALKVTNRSTTVMPAGLGIHPYFRRRPDSQLAFAAEGIVMVGQDQIPNGEIAGAGRFADFTAGATLPDTLIDHTYTGWDGHARIEDDFGAIEIHASGAPYLHVYARPGTDILCLEPVTHLADALNQHPDDMIALEPGLEASLTLRISVSP